MREDDSARLLAELEALRTQAYALSTRLSTNHDPRSRYTGEDRTGLARVIVDGHGRATDVVVARNWRQETDPAGLARALLAAMGEAQARRLEAWAAGGAPATMALLDRTPPTGEPLSGASGADLIRDLLPLLDEAEHQLDEARHQLEKHFTEKAQLTSPGGELTITGQGGQVTEIQFDDRWISAAGAEEVAHRVCLLLQAAHDRSWAGIGDLLPRELGDLMSFAADPERMLRRLGFRA
jgi:DNA-binding protein YbaB